MFDRVREMKEAEGLQFDFEAIDVASNTADALDTAAPESSAMEQKM